MTKTYWTLARQPLGFLGVWPMPQIIIITPKAYYRLSLRQALGSGLYLHVPSGPLDGTPTPTPRDLPRKRDGYALPESGS